MIVRCRAFAVLAFPLFACSEPTVSDRSVDVTLTVDRTVLRAGETAKVAVAATNRGTRSVTINSGGCPAAFVVVEPGGAVAIPGPQTCALILSVHELAPGETYVFRHAWRLDAAVPGEITSRTLPSGSYVLRGRVFGQNLRAWSPPVEIRIDASPAEWHVIGERVGWTP